MNSSPTGSSTLAHFQYWSAAQSYTAKANAAHVCLTGNVADKSTSSSSARDPVVRGLEEAIHIADQSAKAYEKIQKLRPPTVAVHEASR